MGFPIVIMPDQQLPLVPYRCGYLKRYYNRMVKEKEAAVRKQKKKEEKERKSKPKIRRKWSRNRRKKGNRKRYFLA